MSIRRDFHAFHQKVVEVESFVRLFEHIQQKIKVDRNYINTALGMEQSFEGPIKSFKELRCVKFVKSGAATQKFLDDASKNLQDAIRQKKTSEVLKSIELYNKALACELQDCPEVALAYYGRSQALHEIHKYDESFENMELATKCFSESIVDPMKDLGYHCLKRPDDTIPDPEPVGFPLVSTGYPLLPSIANIIHITERRGIGRTVTTSRNIKPAKLIANEEPFLKFLLPSERYRRCAYCFKENFYTLIACKKCTCTLYCNDICLNNGYRQFHQYECDVADSLQEIFGRYNLGIYAAIKYIVSFDFVHEAEHFFKAEENQQRTIFDMSGLGDTPGDQDDLYKLRAIQGLKTHEIQRSVESLATYIIMAMVASHLLLTYTDLRIKVSNEKDKHFFSRLLFHYFLVCDTYAQDIYLLRSKKLKLVPYGCGLYLFSSMLNHSCEPNAVRVYQGDRCLTFTVRPIKAGEEIFIAYELCNFYDFPRQDRLEYLYKRYYFLCRCRACTDQAYLPFKRADPKEPVREGYIMLEPKFKGYRPFKKEGEFGAYQHILNVNEEKYPCKEGLEAIIDLELDLYCALVNVPLIDRLSKSKEDLDKSKSPKKSPGPKPSTSKRSPERSEPQPSTSRQR